MKSDKELTEKLRYELLRVSDGNPKGALSYEWYHGEVLYRGNPISFDNLTVWKKKAALRVLKWATKENN